MKKSPINIAGALLLVSAASNLAIANQMTPKFNEAWTGPAKADSAASQITDNPSALPNVVSVDLVSFVPPGEYVIAALDRNAFENEDEHSNLGIGQIPKDLRLHRGERNGQEKSTGENSGGLLDAEPVLAVPEGGPTALLLGIGLIGMTVAARRRETTG